MDLRFLQFLQCLQLVISCIAGFNFPRDQLYEGSECNLENNVRGICRKDVDCPEKSEATIHGRRSHLSSDHCGFVKNNEIVCCPVSSSTTRRPGGNPGPRPSNKFSPRISDRVCQEIAKIIPISVIRPTIFSGTAVGQAEFPFMVALGYEDKQNNNSLKYICGGSLISKSYVLTAAHCVFNIYNEIPKEARLGTVDLSKSVNHEQRIAISEIHRHPKYSFAAHYYDIALLKLEKPVKFSDVALPICLQSKIVSSLDTTDVSILATGFGHPSYDEELSKQLLKSANLNQVPTSLCNLEFQKTRKIFRGIDDSMLCFKDLDNKRQSDACQGDSGGPLILKSESSPITLIGVISFGSGCGSSVPGIYTAVYDYLDWIESVVWSNNDSNLLV